MKLGIKIWLVFLGIIILLIIHPTKIIYVPKIKGKVIGENGKPILGATVSRIEERESKNKEFGYYEYTEFKSQNTKTDNNGAFILPEKSRIEWIHLPFELPIVWCFGNFEISKNGYKTYKTKFGEYVSFRKENCTACEKIELNPIIKLKTLNK